jgi:hypothetical protein
MSYKSFKLIQIIFWHDFSDFQEKFKKHPPKLKFDTAREFQRQVYKAIFHTLSHPLKP